MTAGRRGKTMPKFARIDTLRHTQEMLRELRLMSAADRDPFLAYLLDMAYLEASDRIRAEYAGASDHEAATGPTTQRAG